MSRFTVELKKAVTTTSKDINNLWKQSVAETFSQVVLKTPVDKGAAKASWLMGYNNDGSIGDKQLSITPSDIPDVGSSYLLFSNIPYIERLEDGWSQQAPIGMVKVTVANWKTIVARFNA